MTEATTGAAPLLVADSLRKEYEHVEQGRFRRRRDRFAAVDDVSLAIAAGETLGLVGESGSGKSTIGRMILGLTAPTAGSITFDGRDITRRTQAQRRALTRDIQVVFQDPYASLDPRQRIEDTIREPLDIHRIGTPAERADRVREVMKRVALPGRMARFFPHQLSGGLRQRVCIATALVVEPRLIVADEPVSALDVSVQAQILDLFDEVRQASSLGVLFISHDLSVVHQVSDRVAVMRRGRLLETGTAGQVFSDPRHPYTKALLSAVPPADPSAPFEPVFYREDAEAV
ncbi:MAG TPA: ATP-binding cassette domain-containing protein [Trebonia sp.]|jgi:ABC-type glutathione transport system ATPase component|nr:ATP-binding cassette domain-containing protein [Trebonia sp.]